MMFLKRLGAGAVALGVVAATMVMTAPLASAHTGTLTTASVCDDDGTYTVTYTGETHKVPVSGPGHVATLTVGEIKPAGSPISGAPDTVTGNTTYTFEQIVPGKATNAQATAFLKWGDGAKADPIGKIGLPGNCAPTPMAPSGNLATECADNSAHVWAGKLDNGTASAVSWRLVSGSSGSHTTVVGGPTSGLPLSASGLPDATRVFLQYKIGNGEWQDEGSAVTTGNCTPDVVLPTGSFTVLCTETDASVTIGALDSGTQNNVEWTFTYNDAAKTVSAGDVITVPALATLALKWTSGSSGATVQEGTAPAACVPTGDRSLAIVKSVDPTGTAQLGDTLTYTLKVTAGGSLGQTHVVVSDYIPGHKPGRGSVPTTYVADSAACDAGPCTATYDSSAKRITWSLGEMAAGATRSVTFKVTIDELNTISADAGATNVVNSADVGSSETPNGPSNEVKTPITDVLGVTHGQPTPADQPTSVLGVSLPHTGASRQLPLLLGTAGLFLFVGAALILLARKPEVVRER